MRLGRDISGGRSIRRALALSSVVALLLGQLAASVHTHTASASDRVNAAAELSADNGLCALCLLAFHSTPEPSAAPALHRPDIRPEPVGETVAGFVESPAFARAMTRAPPALA
jgi:hypothetical protein